MQHISTGGWDALNEFEVPYVDSPDNKFITNVDRMVCSETGERFILIEQENYDDQDFNDMVLLRYSDVLNIAACIAKGAN